jgi:DMSO reductase anchor subunit
VALILLVLLIGEWIERYLFFTAVVAPKMPGSPAS